MNMENSGLVKLKAFFKKAFLASVVTGILLTFTGCYFFPTETEVLAPPLREPEKITYSTTDVKRGIVEKRAACIAYFISAKQMSLSFKDRGGYLKAVYVNTGDMVRTDHNSKKADPLDGKINDKKEDVSVKQGDVLAELDTDTLENDIKMQEFILNKAELTYEKMKMEFDIQSGGDKFALKQTAIDVDMARLKLEDLKSELGKSKLICPVSGIIDFIDDTKVGEYINSNRTFIRIIDPTQLLLESADQEASQFRFGMKVDVKIKGKPYNGEVIKAAYDATEKDYQKAVDSGKTQEYTQLMDKLQNTIRIKVSDLPEDIAIGDSAEVSVSLLKKENVLMLPKKTIHDFQDRKYVKVLKDGIISEQYIEVGIESDTDSEIIGGLEEGDKVLLN